MGTPQIPSVDSDTKLFPKPVMDALGTIFPKVVNTQGQTLTGSTVNLVVNEDGDIENIIVKGN